MKLLFATYRGSVAVALTVWPPLPGRGLRRDSRGDLTVGTASGPWPTERRSGRPRGSFFTTAVGGYTPQPASRESRVASTRPPPDPGRPPHSSSQMPTLRDAALGCIRIMDTPLYDEHEASSSPPSGSPPPSLPPSPVRKSRHPKLTHEHAITKRRARAPLLCRPRSLLTSIRRRQMRSRAPHRPS